mgnify:CR=1 FL=1
MRGRRLILVRHAPAADTAGRCIGWHDVALGDEGREAARTLAGCIAPARVRVHASDLARARETAALLVGAAPPGDAAWREAHFGAWEGRTWAAIEADDASRLDAWMRDWVATAPPGGESFATVVARVGAWLDAHAVATHADDDARPQLVVAHAGAIRAALVRSLAIDATRAFAFAVDHLHAWTLELSPTGTTVLRGNVPLPHALVSDG